MRTVESEDGDRLLLVKAASDSCLVRDPATGEERYVARDRLTDVDGDAPLVAAATGISEPVRRVLRTVHDDRSLGLLVEVVDRGAVAVVDLLGGYDLCESDFNGLLAELRAAGLVEETTVAGERGYEATDLAREAVAALRAASQSTG